MFRICICKSRGESLGGGVSIIIPCKEVDRYAEECVKHCLALDYPNYEILLLPDHAYEKMEHEDSVKVIPTGPLTPGAKRNIGVANSKEDICAFIDSDAYPRSDWLKNAVKYFGAPQIAAVGGPGITPKEDTLMQRAGGYVLSSAMVGSLSNRYRAEKVFVSGDIHSCNFIVRKLVLEAVGGWDEKYWPGEDTLLCLAIRRTGKTMIESSDAVVYHHRRPLFKKHLAQVSRFGLHRGFFAKKFQGNSLKLTYFIPTLIVLSFLTGLAASFFIVGLSNILLLVAAAYLLAGLVATLLEVRAMKLVPLVWLGIIVTHIVYGTYFLIGLTKSDMKR